ncbi:MAG TPA: SRPBCC family protein [Thermoanaerobaculia bacterium]|jgi:hypothetical protein
MAVVVERSLNVASAPQTVWGLLVNLESWKAWWPDCVAANATDFRTLREGSKIELVLQPRHRKMTFNPVVDLLTEGKTLSLTHATPLLQGTVVWTVAEGPNGARVGVRGVFKGVRVWLGGVAGGNDVFQLSLYANLRGLKKLAERM